jgi:hypothetical protein
MHGVKSRDARAEFHRSGSESSLVGLTGRRWLAQVIRNGLLDFGTVEPVGGPFAINEAASLLRGPLMSFCDTGWESVER